MKKLLIIFLLFLPNVILALNISEVYFDGHDERVEVVNDTQLVFSGEIELIGVSSSGIKTKVSLQQEERVIFSDKSISFGCDNFTGQKLSISDTKEINISLLVSGAVISDFLVEEDQIKTWNDQKTSIFKQGTGYYLTEKNSVFSVTNNTYGQPCLDKKGQIRQVVLEQDNPALIVTGESLMTGNVDVISTKDDNFQQEKEKQTETIENIVSSIENTNYYRKRLIINEVYAVGNRYYPEYLALSAVDDITDRITIEGGGRGSASIYIDVSLKKGEKVFVVQNKNETPIAYNEIVKNNLSLTDTGEQINLVGTDGIILDSVKYVGMKGNNSIFFEQGTEGGAVGLPTKEPYFEKTIDCSLAVDGNLIYLKQEDEFCGKGRKKSRKVNGEQQSDKCFLNLGETENREGFFSLFLGEKNICNSSFFIQTRKKSDIVINNNSLEKGMNSLQISEIHPLNSEYGEYIEILCTKECSGEIIFSGASRGNKNDSFYINGYSGSHIVFSKDSTKISGSISYPGLSLLDGGETISLLGQSGHIIDTAVYFNGLGPKESRYRKELVNFTYKARASPGMGLDFLAGLIGEKNKDFCSIKIQNKKTILFPNKINLIAQLNGKEIQNSSKTYRCDREGDEWIGSLEGCNPGYVGFEQPGLKTLKVTIYGSEGLICETTNKINLPSMEEKEPKKTNYYKKLYLKRKEKYTLYKKENGSTTEKVSKGRTNHSGLIVSGTITGVLPDPIGPDTKKEKIWIKIDEKIKENGYSILVDGKKRKKIGSGIAVEMADGIIELQDSFGFTNRPTCISLEKEKVSLDTFCYGQPKEGEIITEKLENIQTINGISLGEIKLGYTDLQACVYYKKQAVLCKDLLMGINELKILKKQAKKKEITDKKVLDLEEKLQKQKENELKKLTKKDSKVKKLEGTITMSKNILSLQKELIYGIQKKLKNEFGVIYSIHGFVDSYSDFNVLLGLLKKGIYSTTLGGVSIKTTNLGEYKDLKQGKLSLSQQNISDIGKKTIETTKEYIGKIKQTITTYQN